MSGLELTQERELAKALVLLLKGDNTGTNNIHSIVQDRVYIAFSPVGQPVTYPQITFEVVLDDPLGALPAEHGELRIGLWFSVAKSNYVGNSAKLSGRINYLINKKPLALNDNNSNLKCRLCDRVTQINMVDDNIKAYHCSMIFGVILGI